MSGGKPTPALGGDLKNLPERRVRGRSSSPTAGTSSSWKRRLAASGAHHLRGLPGPAGLHEADRPGRGPSSPTVTSSTFCTGRSAHRFDPDKLALSGDPIPLAERVGENNTRALFSVSTGERSHSAWHRRRHERAGLGRSRGRNSGSGGGRRLRGRRFLPRRQEHRVFADGPEHGDPRHLVRDLSAIRLAADVRPGGRGCPVWSPDGASILYASNGGGSYACVQKASDGTGDERVLYKDDTGRHVPVRLVARRAMDRRRSHGAHGSPGRGRRSGGREGTGDRGAGPNGADRRPALARR